MRIIRINFAAPLCPRTQVTAGRAPRLVAVTAVVVPAVADCVDPENSFENVPDKVQGMPGGMGIQVYFGFCDWAMAQIVRGMDCCATPQRSGQSERSNLEIKTGPLALWLDCSHHILPDNSWLNQPDNGY